MRVYVLDPALREPGHHLHFAGHAVAELRARGDEVRVYGHREMTAEVKGAPGTRPLFRFSMYQKRTDAQGDFDLAAKLFAEDLAALGGEGPRNDDLVVLPTAGAAEMLGLARWAQAARARPRVAAHFHFVAPIHAAFELGAGTLGGTLYRQAASALFAAVGKRCLIGATNRRLAGELAGAFEREVEVLPLPHWYGAALPAAPAAAEKKRPLVAFLGVMRPEKGHGAIPELVRELHARRAGADVVIHIGAVARGPAEDLKAYDALAREGLAVLVQRWLSDAELDALMASASLIALPYGRESYARNISGVFAFAAAAGRPCVVPAGTWMAEQIAAGRAAGIAFQPDTVRATAGAILKALAARETLLARAAPLAQEWRRDSGPALIARLMEWATRA